MTIPHASRPHVAALRRARRRRVAWGRAGLIGSGGVLLLLAVAVAPTPLPIGFFFLAAGLYLLARGSKRARRHVKVMRRQMPFLSRGLNRAKHRLPRSLRAFIERSDPGA